MNKKRLKFRKSRLIFGLYSTILLILAAAITSIIISTNASAFSGSGTGTALDPYLVTNCTQFGEVNNASSAYYKQTVNIDCGGSSVTITSFSGDYDGQNYTISNIYLTSLPDPDPIGVFSSVSNGTIRNLNLTGITIVDNSQEQSWPLPSYPGPIGAFVGQMDGGTIDNCSVTGNINDSLSADYAWMEIAGGFVGLAEGNATFTDSHADVDISLSHETYGGIGGFVGQSRGTSSFSNNYAKGDISSGSDSYFTGGFVGWMVGNSTIDNSYANGNVHVGIGTPDDVLGYYGDNYDIGGFVGGAGGYSSYLGTISIDNCYSTGNVTAEGEDNYDIGGFAGTIYDGATVTNSFSYGNVNNPNQWGNAIGGFTGLTRDRYSQALPSISKCFSAGSVNVGDTLAWDVGGFVGEHRSGTISNSYSRSNVNMNDKGNPDSDESGNIATFAGRFSGAISNSYSAGELNINTLVDATSVGGFVGWNYQSLGTVNSSYWDTTVSGTSSSPAGGTGLSTSAMKTQSSFSGWDFASIWNIDPGLNDGYPQFISQLPTTNGTTACGQQCSYDAQCLGSLYPYTCDEVTDHPELNKCELIESYCTDQGQSLGADECSCTGGTPTSTPVPTDTPTPTVTITSTLSVTPTATETVTPTDTLTSTPTLITTTIPLITTIDVPTLPPVTTIIINENPKCSAALAVSASEKYIKPGSDVVISWNSLNAENVELIGSNKNLGTSGSFTTNLDETTTFTFLANGKNCQSTESITVTVFDVMPWETGIIVGGSALVVETALATISALFSSSNSMLAQQGMRGNILFAIAGFIEKKKKKKWGIVYDSVSKKPIPRAIVRMLNSGTDEVIETVVTDARGIFNLNANKGKYLIKVIHNTFTFPSNRIKKDEDGGYINIYKGGIFEIKNDEKQVMISIPLDPKFADQSQVIMNKVKQGVSSFTSSLSIGLVAIGFAYSIYAALVYPHAYNYMVLLMYLILGALKAAAVLIDNPKTHGEIKDLDGNPIAGLEIGLFDPEFKTLLYRTFTSEAGKYNFAVSDNSYELKILDSMYKIYDKGLEYSSTIIDKAKSPGVRLITKSFIVKRIGG